jgi:hypothetical protein
VAERGRRSPQLGNHQQWKRSRKGYRERMANPEYLYSREERAHIQGQVYSALQRQSYAEGLLLA